MTIAGINMLAFDVENTTEQLNNLTNIVDKNSTHLDNMVDVTKAVIKATLDTSLVLDTVGSTNKEVIKLICIYLRDNCQDDAVLLVVYKILDLLATRCPSAVALDKLFQHLVFLLN